ncbi:type II toxin-antitoxin system RelE/ParE family toxin [Agrobacterium vitis]|uniref:Type II toxin-antitoxin system RelE/ParE family toxin n=1 Tax=Agrobacterium vitis TaxID=373 RepID=A0AAE5AWY8_AGRVI|nr:type II toxin-antitoxin system RelE/ParE family toxin [Agrobacterium vitis]MCF1501955.1 type II toxin-antitoxin system RelE/ParE family toxin [Allorhizobium sp. Av2]MCM2443432.1 type II toxin-antitoxin system RelE/ParE family toxin [Agrobacterium vitis]MUZ58627.1 type II toxin-antitoxin system RelE/ParE family toxin [Agrobacterium vitis]MVA65680.1 type II toxin-antitoxin system RelE/ParE family toxin [Agrobacterium vitis]MVA88299.1 type II toxin-antitoxin system RelE/ParE family toxin [Agro
MKHYTIRLSLEAQTDLVEIHESITTRSGSAVTADRYIERIDGFLSSFDVFPERGTVRNEIRPGLRIVGFELSVSVAFVVEDDDVVILRILAGGRELTMDE